MDWRDLIAGVGGLNPHGGSAFLRGFQRAKQEIAEREAREAQAGQRQEDLTLRKNADVRAANQDTRAANQDTRATQAQRLAAVNTLRGLLEDQSIDDPAVFQQRMNFVTNMAPQVGAEPDFFKAFTPAPTVFQQRAAQKKLAAIEKAYSPQQLQMLEADTENGAAPFFKMMNGEQWTVAQLRSRAGTQATAPNGQAMSMRLPEAPEQQKPETRGLDVQAADALSRGDAETYQRLLKVKKEMGQADDRPRITVNTGQGLPASTMRRVDSKTRAFDSLPIVKTTQKMAEAVSFADALDVNTKSPSDDQALIYAFAKAMDPDSVVREGEYATVQKYAQSWAERFGFSAARVFSNTAFLTPQARANMKATIRTKYASARPQYDNVRRSYATQINRITGGVDGDEYLTDYAGGFPSTEPAARGSATYDDYLRAKGKK